MTFLTNGRGETHPGDCRGCAHRQSDVCHRFPMVPVSMPDGVVVWQRPPATGGCSEYQFGRSIPVWAK